MHVKNIATLVVFAMGYAGQVSAQNAQIQFQSKSTVRTVNAEPTTVSRDLLAIYEKTKSIQSEQDVTAIARACSKIIPDRSRSQVDQDYASNLLAWSLNRRGEMRSELAAQLVEKNQLAEADKLDSLAARDFETAITYGKPNWRTHHNLAISLAMKGEYQRGIAEFSRTIELKPDYPNAYFNRGELYFEIGQFSNAVNDYNEAITLSSNDPQYYNSRGHSKFMLESYDDALADYQMAADLGNDSAVYHTDLADANQFLGRWKAAATGYRTAIAVNGNFSRAYQNASWLMATCPEPDVRNVELALSAAKKAIELGGAKTSRSLDTLAAATAAAGKHAEAAKLQRQALQIATNEEEKQELAQRLQLYQQGQAYQQPKPMTNIASSDNAERIRTASGSDRRSR